MFLIHPPVSKTCEPPAGLARYMEGDSVVKNTIKERKNALTLKTIWFCFGVLGDGHPRIQLA